MENHTCFKPRNAYGLRPTKTTNKAIPTTRRDDSRNDNWNDNDNENDKDHDEETEESKDEESSSLPRRSPLHVCCLGTW